MEGNDQYKLRHTYQDTNKQDINQNINKRSDMEGNDQYNHAPPHISAKANKM